MKSEDFIMMPVPASAFTAVCALLGGAALVARGEAAGGARPAPAVPAAEPQPQPEKATGGEQGQDQGGAAGGADVSGEIDAHGHPWSPELHVSTKGKTKDGLWRMKVGVSRPAPLPGFPKSDAAGNGGTGTANGGAGSDAGGSAAGGAAGPATGEDEDEFAAFRAAAAKSAGTDAAAAAAAPARKWTDADLGALCNQAAVKLGDPAPIKAIIATFVPEGQVPHSRNIPEARREEFAKAVEEKAGITFAG